MDAMRAVITPCVQPFTNGFGKRSRLWRSGGIQCMATVVRESIAAMVMSWCGVGSTWNGDVHRLAGTDGGVFDGLPLLGDLDAKLFVRASDDYVEVATKCFDMAQRHRWPAIWQARCAAHAVESRRMNSKHALNVNAAVKRAF